MEQMVKMATLEVQACKATLGPRDHLVRQETLELRYVHT